MMNDGELIRMVNGALKKKRVKVLKESHHSFLVTQ